MWERRDRPRATESETGKKEASKKNETLSSADGQVRYKEQLVQTLFSYGASHLQLGGFISLPNGRSLLVANQVRKVYRCKTTPPEQHFLIAFALSKKRGRGKKK